MDQVPQHILDAAEQNPNIDVMEWQYTQVVEALPAKIVMAFVQKIKAAFLELLHTSNASDEDIRKRLIHADPSFADFAKRYPPIFEKITTRDIVLSPPLLSMVIFQVYLLERREAGDLSEDECKQQVAKFAYQAILGEMKRKGITPPAQPAPPEGNKAGDQADEEEPL